LEAIDEAVGRATELGRPVFFSAGAGDIVGAEGMQVLAGLDILSFIARKCAEYNARVITTVCKENVQAITEEVVRTAYSVAGLWGKGKFRCCGRWRDTHVDRPASSLYARPQERPWC
jgi:hypothetical protein